MRSLLHLLRLLCVALLLPSMTIAAAETGHPPEAAACCAGATGETAAGHHGPDGPSRPGEHGAAGDHLDCGMHPCSWLGAPGVAALPGLALRRGGYRPERAALAPPVRAERLHRPPVVLS